MPEEDSTILRMYYAGEGLYFGRLPGGDVRILKINEQTGAPEADFNVPSNKWIAVMAAVAAPVADESNIHNTVKGIRDGRE